MLYRISRCLSLYLCLYNLQCCCACIPVHAEGYAYVGVVGLFFFQAEDGIRDLVRSRGLGDVYKRQARTGNDGQTGYHAAAPVAQRALLQSSGDPQRLDLAVADEQGRQGLSLIHI